jgi:basic membrane lipoprotein Med (substrate-binding protein (PBP1-ABC) superfamily)
MKISRIMTLLTTLASLLMACGSPAATAITPTATPIQVASHNAFRVAVIMPSAINDVAFSQSMYDALVRIQNDMGGPEKMEFVYSQGMYIVDDAAAALRIYASQDYDLVIAHGSQYGASVQTIALEFPGVSFVLSNAPKPSELPNVFDINAAAHEGGYVNGVLAAALSERRSIGIVGPVEMGEAKRYIDGFKAGATATDPELQLNVSFIGSFSDVVKASEAATSFISAGADVMTGTGQMVVGPIGKANEKNVLWFGTQSNQTSLGPKVVVASQVYYWDVALRKVIASVQSGALGGETLILNLANGGEVIEYNPDYAVPLEVQALIDETIQGIANKTIKIVLP